MKKVLRIHLIILAAIIFFIATGCKKEEPAKLPVLSGKQATDTTVLTIQVNGKAPVVTTQSATDILAHGYATLNGTVIANNSSAIVTFEYGTTTNYGNSVTAYQSPVTGNSLTTVSYRIENLTPMTICHFRVKAENSQGTAYGDDMTFTSLGVQAPSIARPIENKKAVATNISATGATISRKVNANGLSTTVTFEYGTTTSYGSIITAFQSPVAGNIDTYVSADITDLTPGTTYHFRVKAENSDGIVYGTDYEFTVFKCSQAPIVTVLKPTNITDTSATLNGTVNANGLPTEVRFIYQSIRTGWRYIFNPMPSIATGDSITNVSALFGHFSISSAAANGRRIPVWYYVWAKNSCGITYSNMMYYLF
jgi:hypothetical protein